MWIKKKVGMFMGARRLILLVGFLMAVGVASAALAQFEEIIRTYGDNRYETAAEISEEGWRTSDTVIISRDDEFADALSSTPLAYHLDAPVLLTSSDELHAATKEEIEELRAEEAVLLGGEEALSPNVKEEIENMGLSVKRYGGEDRFETATLIAKEMLGYDKAVLATGQAFQDALVIGPFAAREGWPILLTEPDDLPDTTRDFLDEEGINQTLLVGGADSVTENVKANLADLGDTRRIGGNTYHETAVKVSEAFSDTGNYYLSRDDDFPDSLTGAVLAAKEEASILLSPTHNLDKHTGDYLKEREERLNSMRLLGGEQALSTAVEDDLRALFNDNDTPENSPSQMTAVELYEEVTPSIVFMETDDGKSGTGFVVDEDGIIATSHHLVDDANRVQVELLNQEVYYAEEIVSYDRESDLALLSIDTTALKALTLGDSYLISAGEEILVVGNPEDFKHSISGGMISYPLRELEGRGEFIQMTAPVSSGSSGSPVFNAYGEVIGISSMILVGDEVQKINFASPVNKLKELMDAPEDNLPLDTH